jgi:hypothetical protein
MRRGPFASIIATRLRARGPGVAGGILLAVSGWMMPQWEAALSSLLFLVATLAILRTVGAGLWSGAYGSLLY